MQLGIKQIILGGAVALLLQTSTHAGLLSKLVDGKPKRIELTETTDKATAFKEAYTQSGAFSKAPVPIQSGTKKLVVAGFQVEFATEQKGIAHGNGVDAGLASTNDKVYTLKGVSDSQLQSITDKLYTDFVTQLQSKGYEVLPPNVLVETGYKEAMAKANQAPVHHARGTAMDLLFTPKEKEVDNASVIATAKDTSPAVFTSAMMGWGAGPKTADALQANIVHLRMKVNFAKFEESGWFSPEVDDKPQNVIAPTGTSLQVFSPSGKVATYPLAHSVILPNKVSDTAIPVEATAGQTGTRAAGGVGRMLTGLLKGGVGGVADIAAGATASAHTVMVSGNFEVEADQNYEEVVTKDVHLMLNVIGQAFP